MSDTPELETYLKRIDDARRMAAIDPDDPQYIRTRAGISVAVANAKENLPKLSKDYRDAVLRNGVAIFLFGSADKVGQFAALVNEMGEAVVVNASEMYERLADAVERTLGNTRQFGSFQSTLLMDRVNEIAAEAEVILPKPLLVTDTPVLPNHESVLRFVRNSIRDQLGDLLASEYLKRQFGREAEKIRYMLNVAPAIVINAQTADDVANFGAFFGKGHQSVDLPEDVEITKEYITKTFKNVQKALKKYNA